MEEEDQPDQSSGRAEASRAHPFNMSVLPLPPPSSPLPLPPSRSLLPHYTKNDSTGKMKTTCLVCHRSVARCERAMLALLPCACSGAGLHVECWSRTPLSSRAFWPCPVCGRHITAIAAVGGRDGKKGKGGAE